MSEIDAELERKALEYASRKSDDIAEEWTAAERRLANDFQARGVDAGGPGAAAEMATAFVRVVRHRIDAVVEGYLKHAIYAPISKYDRELLREKAQDAAAGVQEKVRERFGAAVADEHALELEAYAIRALKDRLDPV